MKANIGNADRTIRIILGLILLALFGLLDGDARWWGLAGLIPLGTAIIRYCPLYAPFGIRTCKADE